MDILHSSVWRLIFNGFYIFEVVQFISIWVTVIKSTKSSPSAETRAGQCCSPGNHVTLDIVQESCLVASLYWMLLLDVTKIPNVGGGFRC
jgi:hypothetical protein